MLTVDALQQYGANVQEGLERCMNDEAFYLEMVNLTLNDENYEKLSEAIRVGDKTVAFDAAHALKGVVANVALTPLFARVSEVTELLRAREDADYPAYLEQILREREKLITLRDN